MGIADIYKKIDKAVGGYLPGGVKPGGSSVPTISSPSSTNKPGVYQTPSGGLISSRDPPKGSTYVGPAVGATTPTRTGSSGGGSRSGGGTPTPTPTTTTTQTVSQSTPSVYYSPKSGWTPSNNPNAIVVYLDASGKTTGATGGRQVTTGGTYVPAGIDVGREGFIDNKNIGSTGTWLAEQLRTPTPYEETLSKQGISPVYGGGQQTGYELAPSEGRGGMSVSSEQFGEVLQKYRPESIQPLVDAGVLTYEKQSTGGIGADYFKQFEKAPAEAQPITGPRTSTGYYDKGFIQRNVELYGGAIAEKLPKNVQPNVMRAVKWLGDYPKLYEDYYAKQKQYVAEGKMYNPFAATASLRSSLITPKTYVIAPGATTRRVEATPEVMTKLKLFGEQPVVTKYTPGYPQYVVSGLLPRDMGEAGKLGMAYLAFSKLGVWAPRASNILMGGVGAVSVPAYLKASTPDEKAAAAVGTLGLLGLTSEIPRVTGFFRTRGRTEVPVEGLIPPKTKAGEETFPLAPRSEHLKLFEQFSQRLPGQRANIPLGVMKAEYARANIFGQLKMKETGITPYGHSYSHARAVGENVVKLIDAYPEFTPALKKTYGSIEAAKAQLAGKGMWHDALKVGSSSRGEFFGKHGEAFYALSEAGKLPREVMMNRRVAEAIKIHETTYGAKTPEAKILATADRLDLVRFRGKVVNPKMLPLRDALGRVKGMPTPEIPGLLKYRPSMDKTISAFNKKYVVSYSTGEVAPRPTAPPQMIHATGNIFWSKGVTAIKSGSSELPGLYGSYGLSPNFLKIGGSTSSTIGLKVQSFISGLRPSILVIKPKGFREMPVSKVAKYKSDGTEFTQKFTGKTEPGIAYVPGTKTEVEAILPPTSQVPGQGLKLVSREYYTRYPQSTGSTFKDIIKGRGRFGVRVPIDQAITVDTTKMGGIKVSSGKGGVKEFTGSSSYGKPTEFGVVVPITYSKDKVSISPTKTSKYNISRPSTSLSMRPYSGPSIISRPSAPSSRPSGRRSRMSTVSSSLVSEAPSSMVSPRVYPRAYPRPYSRPSAYPSPYPYPVSRPSPRPVPRPNVISYPSYGSPDISRVSARRAKAPQGFDVFIKRKGKLTPLGISAPFETAKAFGRKKLLGSLAATAYVRPSGRALTTSMVVKSSGREASLFRSYRVRKGAPVGFDKTLLIQKKSTQEGGRLVSVAERKELQAYRKRKKFF